MSLFEKICEQEVNTQEFLIESVTNQIAIIFANRNDQYWAFDVDKLEMIAVHDLFKMDLFSPSFARGLARAIQVFDRRIKDVKIDVIIEKSQVVIFINANVRFQETVVPIVNLKFAL